MASDAVSYDRRSFFLHGKPFLVLSGAVHYVRVHPSRWDALFDTFRAAGLNTLETYVFWGDHEAFVDDRSAAPFDLADDHPSTPPPPCFDARLDLFAFVDAAAAAGLAVILRLGPYVCAEADYGGLPARLRDVPGLVLRTWNEPFMAEMGRWLRLVAKTLHERKQLASAGGPVILVQLENEYDMISSAYGDAGKKYLQWAANLQRDLALDVPAIMCVGAADGVVETINAFYAHGEIDALRARHPDQPPVWTECWSGWYDVWGAPHSVRPAQDLVYAVARFFASGGAGVNYYMWMGGSNFGRSTMYLQKTSYDYDAPVDEFYAMTDKAVLLARLHKLLTTHFLPAFHATRDKDPELLKVGEDVVLLQWGDLAFVCNDGKENACQPGTVSLAGTPYPNMLAPRSVHLVDTATPASPKLLLDTAQPLPAAERLIRTPAPARGLRVASAWARASEELPRPCADLAAAQSMYGSRNVAVGATPAELVSLVRRRSDYAFYAARLRVVCSGPASADCVLSFEAADFAQLFVDGKLAGATPLPLWEDRWPNRWNSYADGTHPGTRVAVPLPRALAARARDSGDAGVEFDVCVAVASLGLVKADWQLAPGCNMRDERKGLCGEIAAEGAGWSCARVGEWTSVGGTAGEAARLCDTLGASASAAGGAVAAVGTAAHGAVPGWFGCTVLAARSHEWALDLDRVGKGVCYVNGVLLGRFWDVAGTRPLNGFLDDSPVQQTGVGEPSQRFYHVPQWVVRDGDGDGDEARLHVVLFVESGKGPSDPLCLVEMVGKRGE